MYFDHRSLYHCPSPQSSQRVEAVRKVWVADDSVVRSPRPTPKDQACQGALPLFLSSLQGEGPIETSPTLGLVCCLLGGLAAQTLLWGREEGQKKACGTEGWGGGPHL